MNDPLHLLPFLKESPLFSGVAEEQIASLLPVLRAQGYEKGALILEEGEVGEDLFLIKGGSVKIGKKESGEGLSYTLATLHPGEWFGEMPLFGEDGRSASVCALEKTEAVLIPLRELKKPAFSQVMANLAKRLNSRLKKVNEVAVKSLQQELKFAKAHDHMGQFIVHLFVLMTFYFYLVKVFEEYTGDSLLKKVIASLLILMFGISAVLFVKKSEYPLQFYGLTLKNWHKNVCEAALFTVPVLLLMLVVKWVIITSVPLFKGFSLFQFGPPQHSVLHFFHPSVHREEFFLFIFLYILLVPVQEFLARGCLQNGLQNFFRSPNKVFLAILTSNLLFGMFHGLKTFSFAGAAFLLGIFWGWLYARQGSIVGPSVSHALIGAWAFGCLDYASVLVY